MSRRVSSALNDKSGGDQLISSLKNRINEIRSKVVGLPKPTVAFIEWIEPLMAGGNWVPELIDLAGAIDPLGKPAAHSSQISFNRLLSQNPDYLIYSSMWLHNRKNKNGS
jgi:iron complex transport system substrate-binding protein